MAISPSLNWPRVLLLMCLSNACPVLSRFSVTLLLSHEADLESGKHLAMLIAGIWLETEQVTEMCLLPICLIVKRVWSYVVSRRPLWQRPFPCYSFPAMLYLADEFAPGAMKPDPGCNCSRSSAMLHIYYLAHLSAYII